MSSVLPARPLGQELFSQFFGFMRLGWTRGGSPGIFGWSGGTMASLYTRSADRQRLALEAMHKLANDKRTSIPAPHGKVRAQKEKSK